MASLPPKFEVRFARNDEDLKASQRLRYEVFISELGGDGDLVDHDARLEADQFDPSFEHLMLLDRARPGGVTEQTVGVYRLLSGANAGQAGRFYSESEYDLSVLKNSGRKLLELGRSCLHLDYRGGMAMYYLWNALADYVTEHEVEILFGVASFHGTDIAALRAPLSLLHHRHLAPEKIRVKARQSHYQNMNLVAEDQLDRRRAMLATPALIKAYLRMGGTVGEGAFVDHDFNTTDVCLILDTEAANARQKSFYSRGRDR
jgi:L-ornithine Nalpha-acyltransferase